MKKTRNVSLERRFFPYIMILPNFFIFVAFVIIPAGFGFFYALTDWSGLGAMSFIGMENFIRLFHDGKFWTAILRNLYYITLSLPFIMMVPLLLAVLMTQDVKGQSVFRAIFYWPSMISYIVVGISFRFIFGDNAGIINYFLELLHLGRVEWLTNKFTALLVVSMATVWSRSGFYMIAYITGLQSIPMSTFESARVDGATPIQTFFRITLPQLRPTTFLVMILGLIDLFKAYGLIIALTEGGPGTATKFGVQYVYERAFQELDMGYASALSVVMFLLMAGFTIIQFYLNKEGQNDENA